MTTAHYDRIDSSSPKGVAIIYCHAVASRWYEMWAGMASNYTLDMESADRTDISGHLIQYEAECDKRHHLAGQEDPEEKIGFFRSMEHYPEGVDIGRFYQVKKNTPTSLGIDQEPWSYQFTFKYVEKKEEK